MSRFTLSNMLRIPLSSTDPFFLSIGFMTGGTTLLDLARHSTTRAALPGPLISQICSLLNSALFTDFFRIFSTVAFGTF